MAVNNSSAPLKTAGEPFVALGECIADQVCLSVAELPDRDSPADWPQAMLVTNDELRNIVLNAINYAAQAVAAQAAPAAVAVPPSAYLNAAGIKASDKPGTVVRKLDAAFHDAVTFKDATPALPATEDSSAGDLVEVHAEPVANPTVNAIAAAVCQRVAELDDRSSPADWPEAMLVTQDELQTILIEELATLSAPQAQPADRLDADTFWVADDPDAAHDTLHDAVVAAFEGGGVHPGGFVEIGCSASRPSLLVRITSDQPFRFVVEHDAAMAAAQEGGKA